MRLESTVDVTEQHQDESHDAESFDIRSLSWKERLDQKLPWNFEASLYNQYLDDTTTMGNVPEFEVTSRETRLEITHQLYASLRSRYAISYTVSEYPQGETKTTTNSLNFYIKESRLA
jgi:hypothetical protein